MTYDQYAAEIQRLQDALARVAKEAVPQWTSVKDGMPEEGEVVLVYNAKLDSMHIEYPLYLGEPKLHFDAGVTHWMPLPTPPESESDAE